MRRRGSFRKGQRRESPDELVNVSAEDVHRDTARWFGVFTDLDLGQHPRELTGGESCILAVCEGEVVFDLQTGVFECPYVDDVPQFGARKKCAQLVG